MLYATNIDSKKERFYELIINYKKFSGINDEKKEKLSLEAEEFRNQNKQLIATIGLYSKVLDKLIYEKYMSFDEKMFFLIKTVDPELYTFKNFINSHITSQKEIYNEQDSGFKNDLIFKRSNEITQYIRSVRSEVGVYDSKLINFEKDFYRKFMVEHLEQNIMLDLTNKLLHQFEENPIEILSDDQIENIKRNVEIYKKVGFNYKNFVFHLLNQAHALKIKNISEKLVFYINAIDPELEALQTYENECRWDRVEDTITKSLGYFSKELIFIEKIYKKLYLPNIEFDLFK